MYSDPVGGGAFFWSGEGDGGSIEGDAGTETMPQVERRRGGGETE